MDCRAYRSVPPQAGSHTQSDAENLRAMAKDFHEIPRTPKDCTKVGIVGEIYVKYSSFGNNGLEQFLLSQGCEYMVPGVLGFFQYCFANIEMDTNTTLAAAQAPHRSQGGEIAGAWEDWLIEALESYPSLSRRSALKKSKRLPIASSTAASRWEKAGFFPARRRS